ncbi:lipase [Thiomicrorhabdus sp. 6S2-11]|uniref:Lipase n=1 Tax=Thiomicrorhabdus marina TaxID=2818442 RepID=A0ABS3Q2D7_9GAMM|nr:lipase [Thiomicrorhabdus marina]MBO1926273.1 lipase [Thiomicrorhabdus marina]
MKLTTLSKVTKTFLAGAFLSSTALLTGCGGSDQEISLEPVNADASGYVVMNFALSDIPFPHDALFSGSTDGTLNIPVDDPENYADPRVAMNAIDGFSTSAPITFKTSQALEIADSNTNGLSDIFESGVAVYKTSVVIDPETHARVITAIDKQLVPGVDYFPVVSDAETDAKNIAILPLKPLEPKTTYLITVNNTVVDSDGDPLKKSIYYSALSGTESLVGTVYQELEPLRQLTLAHLSAIAGEGHNTDNVVASWSFTTQSIGAVLTDVQTQVSNSSLGVVDTGKDTSIVGGAGLAQLYAGTMSVPYYSGTPSEANPIAPLNTFWKSADGALLSFLNTTPAKNADATIPVLMSVPKIGTKPDAGWPVVIFQHSVTESRTNLLAIADTLANAGFAAVAIDMPLHGVTDTESALYMGALERTFNVDYVTQDGEDVLAAAPDGVIDTSGRHFINLSHLVVTRDNLRQAVSDLMQLRSALENFQSGGLLDASQVSFVGHSLGAMVGGIYQAFEPADEAVYAMPGLQAPYLLAASASFAPEIEAGLAAQGVVTGSSEYQQFLLAAQTVVDSADPVNYVSHLANNTLLFEVVGNEVLGNVPDQTIPNAVATAPLAGTNPWIALQDLNLVSPSANVLTAVSDGKGVMQFTDGHHGSILIPSDGNDVVVTQTMQEAMASFLASGGTSVTVSDDSTVK